MSDEQVTIVDEFESLSSWDERYEYLIKLGRSIPNISEGQKIPKYKVSGCQSRVWLVPHYHPDSKTLEFNAESDSMVVNGLLALLLRIYSGKTAQQILDTDIWSFAAIGLSENLSSVRKSGVDAVVNRIHTYAHDLVNGVKVDF